MMIRRLVTATNEEVCKYVLQSGKMLPNVKNLYWMPLQPSTTSRTTPLIKVPSCNAGFTSLSVCCDSVVCLLFPLTCIDNVFVAVGNVLCLQCSNKSCLYTYACVHFIHVDLPSFSAAISFCWWHYTMCSFLQCLDAVDSATGRASTKRDCCNIPKGSPMWSDLNWINSGKRNRWTKTNSNNSVL